MDLILPYFVVSNLEPNKAIRHFVSPSISASSETAGALLLVDLSTIEEALTGRSVVVIEELCWT